MLNHLPIKHIILCALLFWTFAFCVRLPNLSQDAPQTDEVTWVHRSEKMILHIKEGNISNFSSHCWHPGVIPGIIMSIGQITAKKINYLTNGQSELTPPLDKLWASRLACCFIASLAPAILFLFLYSVFGFQVAFLGALITSLEVEQVAYSRIAHLDGVFSVLILLSIFSYWYAVEYNKLWAKIISGIFWGLSLSTRTFAVVLIPIFLLYRLLRLYCTSDKQDKGERTFISASDFWVLLLGHTIMTLVFTRMWHYPSDYLISWNVQSPLADYIYSISKTLQLHLLPLSLLLFLALGILWVLAKKNIRLIPDFAWTSAFAYIILTLSISPERYDNLIRYYFRMLGLAKITHKSFGHSWTSSPWDYLDLFFSKPTHLALFGFFAAILFFVLSARKLQQTEQGRKHLSFFLLTLLIIFLWCFILSFTHQHAYRYIFPVTTLALGISAYGIMSLLKKLVFLTNFQEQKINILPSSIFFILVALTLFSQLAILYSSSPDFLLYANSITGGLKGSVERNHRPLLAGFNDTLTALHENASLDSITNVHLIADKTTVENTYKRLFLNKKTNGLYFHFFSSADNADFVFVVESQLDSNTASRLNDLSIFEKIFDYKVDNVSLTRLYRVLPQSYNTHTEKKVAKAFSYIGHTIRASEALYTEQAGVHNDEKLLYAHSSKDKHSYIFYWERPYFKPGRYRIGLTMGIPLKSSYTTSSENPPVIFFELKNVCKRKIFYKELIVGSLKEYDMDCEIKTTSREELRAFWDGQIPVVVLSYKIARINE